MPSVADTPGLPAQPGRVQGASGDVEGDTIAFTFANERPKKLRFQLSQANGPLTKEESSILHEDGNKDLALRTSNSKVVIDTGDALQLADNKSLRSQKATLGAIDLDPYGDPPSALHLIIRGVMVSAAGPDQLVFLPFNELDSIITIPIIFQELKRSGLTSNLDSISRQVWELKTLDNGEFTTRRKLFAILCLMEKAEDIERFIEEDIFDVDLPFDFKHNQGFRRTGGPIGCFAAWRFCDMDTFGSYQGRFMAPYFKLGNAFREYKLHLCVVLPFVDDELKPSAHGNHALDRHMQRDGGYSVVRRVKMHSAHHDHTSSSSDKRSPEKMYYAVKQLLKQDDAPEDPSREPDRETTAYNYLNSKRHPHIIQLLATFTQKGHLNMIFPWANGNLMDFWQHQFPRTTDLSRNEDLARWLIRQFLGLAQDPSKTHGRHGDLKPENILWFKDSSATIQYSHGNLLISDLGSTEFHATRSKTIRADAAGGHTHTYKAPEFDIKQKVAPKADIWSFGCVLLEFIVWYMCGWEGVKDFANARSKESNLQIRGDHFFNFDQRDSTVLVKASVRKQCNRLREVATATDFIVELLDFVEDGLLQLEPSNRATCGTMIEKFSAIREKSLRDSGYCTRPTKKTVSRAETVQSNKTSVSLSPEMEREYQLNINPGTHILPSGSIRSGPILTTGDDNRSALGEDIDDASYLRDWRRASDVPPPHDWTGTELLVSPVASEGRHHVTPERPGTPSKRYKRALNRVHLSIKRRFRSKSIG